MAGNQKSEMLILPCSPSSSFSGLFTNLQIRPWYPRRVIGRPVTIFFEYLLQKHHPHLEISSVFSIAFYWPQNGVRIVKTIHHSLHLDCNQNSGKSVEFAGSATRSRKAVRMACVTGPGTPNPTGRPSISTTGVSSPIVPVVKT